MNQISRRDLGKGIFAMSLLGVIGAATGCTGPAAPGTTPGATPGAAGATAAGAIARALTIASGEDPQPMNPAKLASAGLNQIFTQAIYGTVLRFNPDGEIVPNFAEKWEANDDNTLYTLTLREGLTFTDGTAYDATAVKNHIDTMKTAGGTDAARVMDLEVTAKDARTVEIACTNGPNGLVPMFLCLSVGCVASPKQYASPNADSEPIGAGPYKLDAGRTTSGTTYTLVRNEDYFEKELFPYDSLVLQVMADPTARMNALQSGQVNAAPLLPQMAKPAEGAGLTVLRHLVNWTGLIIFDREGTKVPPLGDLKVRQAINHAFDRQAILNTSAQGEGEVSHQIFRKDSLAYVTDDAEPYPYDIEKAKSLMAEAGYADGFDLVIPFMEGFSQQNPIVISQLGQIGIRVTEEPLAGMQGFMRILGGEFPMIPFGLESRDALWDVVQAITPNAIWNTLKAEDPELTALCTEAQKAALGEGEETFRAIGKYVLDNAWFAPWYHGNAIFAVDAQTTATATLGSGMPALHAFGGK